MLPLFKLEFGGAAVRVQRNGRQTVVSSSSIDQRRRVFYLFGVFLSKQLKCKLNIKFLNILCFGGEKLPFITFSFHFVQLYIN